VVLVYKHGHAPFRGQPCRNGGKYTRPVADQRKNDRARRHEYGRDQTAAVQQAAEHGERPCDEDIAKYSGAAGFSLEHTQYLNEHYVRTLDTWATNLEAASEEAVAATSEEVYDRYMRYLVGCSDFFRRGISELGQFTLTKS